MSNILAPWLWASIFALLFNAAPKRQNHNTAPKPPSDPFHRELNEKLASASALYNPEKLYLHTDRTLYKPGEDLWYNAFLLNADDLQPSRQSQILYVELLDPRGTALSQSILMVLGGQAAGDFNFPAHLPGGQYKLRAHTLWMKNTEACFERDITLQKVVLPRINLRLEWERKAVGPGEVAIARFDAQSLDNKPIVGREIRFEASVSGEKVAQGSAKTDGNGRAYVRFELPKKLESIDGLLNISLLHNDQTEAISRPIPIVLDHIDLQFFPEGGEAVAGQPCRMAFKAVNEFGKAADVSGEIMNSKKEVVATFSSYHNGMGAFDFIPQAGEKYHARLLGGMQNEASDTPNKPKQYELPKIASKGHTLQLYARNAQYLQFRMYGTHPAKCYLTACSRDKVFFFSELAINETGIADISIPTADCPMGIVRVTLFNEKRQELAERLVFVNRDKGLKFDIKTDKEKYLPQEQVKAKIKVTDHKGQPVQGQFSMAVVDEKQLSFADDKQGHLLAEMLLAQDLKGTVEEPNFYFDAAEAKSETALDYLLLTQGWRRFSWKEVLNPQPVVFQHKPEKLRIAGVLLDNVTNQPLGNRKLKMLYGPTTTTSPEGHFVFENVDLQQFNTIQDEKGKDHWFNTYFNHSVIFEGVSGPVMIANELEGNSKMAVLAGKILEKSTGEPLIGASVVVRKNGENVRGAITDFDGNYRVLVFSGTGNYSLTVTYTGFSTQSLENVKIVEGIINRINVQLESSTILEEVTITSYKVPLIKQDNTSTGQTISINSPGGGGGTRRKKEKATAKPTTAAPAKQIAENQVITEYKAPLIKQDESSTGQALTSEQIATIPTSRVQQNTATTAGMNAIDDDAVNIRGARSNATNYYVDGIRVVNTDALQVIENEELIGNGTPADMEKAEDLDKKKMGKSMSMKDRVRRSADVVKEQPYPAPRQFTRARTFYVPNYNRNSPQPQGSDLRSTIYWNPKVKTDSRGEAEVAFVCTDEVTNFRITIEGIGTTEASFVQIGRMEHKFYVEKPLSVDVKLPASVISGDTLILQAVLHNRTDYAVNGQLTFELPTHFKPCTQTAQDQSVPANSSRTISRAYHVGTANPIENQMIHIAWRSAEAFEDEIVASVRTLDRGFPVRTVMSGSQAQNAFKLQLNEPIEGSMSAVLTAYPSTLDDLLKGMERMLRQPYGCFEQVSSSNYPNLLVLDLLRSTHTIKPEIESQALQYLDDGYKKLVGYECKPGGFDWYGRSPAHEALTAYGILEFTDMAAVYKVDQKMIARALDWLLTRRDGKGGWQSRDGLHSWGNGEMLGAYIAWAMTTSGYGNKIKPEIETAYNAAKQSGDLYQIALMANTLQSLNDNRAMAMIETLIQKQEKDGSWIGSKHSVTHSTGQQLRIETTALATLALLKAKKPVEKAIQYISSQKNEYGYGNTQSTVLALKALVEYAKRNGETANGDGKLIVSVDGRRVAERSFSPQQYGRLEIAGLEQFFTHNTPLVEVYFEKSNKGIPFDLELKYASRQPRNGQSLPFNFQTVLAKNKAKVGETVRLTATLHNTTNAALASPMIILGIPSGLSLQPWQLKKLVEEKRCDYYELWDGYCVFHFESLPAAERRELHLDLRADIAGCFEASASQAYLYYTNEKRMWSKPERLVVY